MASGKSSDSWWAQVMYPSYQNKKECVPVKDIVASVGPKPHRKRTPFCPKHIKDFDQHQLYRVETAIDSVDKRVHPYHVFIGKIRETKAELDADKERPHWPVISEAISDPETETEDTVAATGSGAVLNQRTNTKVSAENKKRAQRLELEKLASDGLMQMNNSDVSSWGEVQRLKAQVAQLEEEKARQLREKEREQADPAANAIRSLTQEIQEMRNVLTAMKTEMQGVKQATEDNKEAISNVVASIRAEISTQTSSLSKLQVFDHRRFVQEWIDSITL